MTSTSTWTLLEGNFESFQNQFNLSLLANSRYVAGGEDLPTGLAGFGQVLKMIQTLLRDVFHIVFIVKLRYKTKLTGHFSGRVLSLCVLQDEY